MQSETQKMSNQQGTQDAAAKKANTSGTVPDTSDENIEPILDEEDMKENHLKEEDLDKIEWDKPAKPDEDLSKGK